MFADQSFLTEKPTLYRMYCIRFGGSASFCRFRIRTFFLVSGAGQGVLTCCIFFIIRYHIGIVYCKLELQCVTFQYKLKFLCVTQTLPFKLRKIWIKWSSEIRVRIHIKRSSGIRILRFQGRQKNVIPAKMLTARSQTPALDFSRIVANDQFTAESILIFFFNVILLS